jgi:hypothetical protein
MTYLIGRRLRKTRMIRSRRIRRNATLAAFLALAAAFEYFAVPRLLMLNVPERGLSTFSSCSIVIGLVGGWLRTPRGIRRGRS